MTVRSKHVFKGIHKVAESDWLSIHLSTLNNLTHDEWIFMKIYTGWTFIQMCQRYSSWVKTEQK